MVAGKGACRQHSLAREEEQGPTAGRRMKTTKINLACGDEFVSGDGWINFDWRPLSCEVQHADLLKRLPLADDSAALVYCSHFLEHLAHSDVSVFLRECHRVLAPAGVLRLVVPDLENLCRTYLTHRELSEHDKANFVVLEMVDQCVRRESGGELRRYYQALREASTEEAAMIDYVRERTGEDLLAKSRARSPSSSRIAARSLSQGLFRHLERVWIGAVLTLLPRAFRSQNVSLTGVGERHQWLWDFEQLRAVLDAVGFAAVERCEAHTSRFAEFPFTPLDIEANGRPRKGAESMYVEAQKPR